MNDKELDRLFAQAVQREKAVEQINRQVMKTVRREMRMKQIRKWARVLGFCFGIPALIVLYIYAMLLHMPNIPIAIVVICLALPVCTIVVFFGKRLHDFSL